VPSLVAESADRRIRVPIEASGIDVLDPSQKLQSFTLACLSSSGWRQVAKCVEKDEVMDCAGIVVEKAASRFDVKSFSWLDARARMPRHASSALRQALPNRRITLALLGLELLELHQCHMFLGPKTALMRARSPCDLALFYRH